MRSHNLVSDFIDMAVWVSENINGFRGEALTKANLDAMNAKIYEVIASYSVEWPEWVEVPRLGVISAPNDNAVTILGSNTAGLWLQVTLLGLSRDEA